MEGLVEVGWREGAGRSGVEGEGLVEAGWRGRGRGW